MSKSLPAELRASIKSLEIILVIMAICGLLTIIGIPWAILYAGLAVMLTRKALPSRGFLIFTAVATLPICIFIAPIFLEVALIKVIKGTGLYQNSGSSGFMSDKAWQNRGYLSKNGLILGTASTIILILIMLIPVPSTTSKEIEIPYSMQYTQDANIELGDTQIRQPGNNGQGLERHKQIKPLFALLLGLDSYYSVSDLPKQTTSAPSNQIIAQGTKKYQYMWCSNGSYRYFTNDQFKDPNVGFTHKSEDACAKSGSGHMTGLADTAPPQQTTQTVYQPSYRYTPTYTTCHEYTYINQFSCTTY